MLKIFILQKDDCLKIIDFISLPFVLAVIKHAWNSAQLKQAYIVASQRYLFVYTCIYIIVFDLNIWTPFLFTALVLNFKRRFDCLWICIQTVDWTSGKPCRPWSDAAASDLGLHCLLRLSVCIPRVNMIRRLYLCRRAQARRLIRIIFLLTSRICVHARWSHVVSLGLFSRRQTIDICFLIFRRK